MNESDVERVNREKRESLNQMMKYLVLFVVLLYLGCFSVHKTIDANAWWMIPTTIIEFTLCLAFGKQACESADQFNYLNRK